MYAGNTVPTEWPRRADRSTYETYAKLPSWHVEEAASVAAALIPRQNSHLKFRPIHGAPGEPKPYEDAKTWGVLLDETEPVGRAISLLARARGLSDWGFSGSDLYVDPAEFVEFCDKCGATVPLTRGATFSPMVKLLGLSELGQSLNNRPRRLPRAAQARVNFA